MTEQENGKTMKNHKTTIRTAGIPACLFIMLALIPFIQAEPVARVGKTDISIEAVRSTAARNGYDLSDPASTQRAVDDEIAFELLANEAKRLGYMDDPEIIRVMKSMAVQKLVKEKVDSKLKSEALTEEQYRAYYDANMHEFSNPALVRGRILMVLKREGGKARFDDAVAALEKGTGFAEVVKQYADDASARANGGMSSWLSEARENKRYPKQVVETLFGLAAPNDVSEPFETDRAFYMVQLSERRDGRVIPFEDAKNMIARKLKLNLRAEAYAAYVETLKNGVDIKIDEKVLQKSMQENKPGDGPPSGPVPQAQQ